MLYWPLDHGAAASKWVEEDELMDVLMSAKKFMVNETCGLFGAP